jgi:hypothetical protein
MTITHSPRQYSQAEKDGRCAVPADLTVERLTALVISPLARCAGSGVSNDEWFPVASRPACARAKAARALALCAVCPVRAECLELSMRIWPTGGQYGIWGGLVEGDRAAVRRDWVAGVPVMALLPDDRSGHQPAAPRRPPP